MMRRPGMCTSRGSTFVPIFCTSSGSARVPRFSSERMRWYRQVPVSSRREDCKSQLVRHCVQVALHSTPDTRHPTPHTLHPTPYTLYPTPYTLHTLPSTTYTLHPTPYTLHIQVSFPASTLNPKLKPQALDPKPQTRNLESNNLNPKPKI